MGKHKILTGIERKKKRIRKHFRQKKARFPEMKELQYAPCCPIEPSAVMELFYNLCYPIR